MPLRIALIDNLSAAAWRLIAPPFAAEVQTGPPSATLARLRSGDADAALVPVTGLAALADMASPLGDFGIACQGPVRSVTLFSRTPLAEVLRARLPVHVTEQSETSRRLLQVMCRLRYGREPLLAGIPDEAVARLLIGDDAVDGSRAEQCWPVRIDLGRWWFDSTGLPFVFARWVVRENVDGATRTELLRWLAGCAALAEQEAGVEELAKRAAGLRLTFSASLAREYYRAVRPRLTPRDLRGLRLFLTMQQEFVPWARTA
jgi:chorismate dehydratase